MTAVQQLLYYKNTTMVAFFFTDQIAPINPSKNLPFFFTAQNNPIKMLRVLFL